MHVCWLLTSGLWPLVFALSSHAAILFQSNFECGQTYTAAALRPGAKEIELLPCEELSQWPKAGGQGIIEGNYPEASEAFQYTARENRTLHGVTGLNRHHAKWVAVHTSNFMEWNAGRLHGLAYAPSKISLEKQNPLAGRFSARVDWDTAAVAALLHSFSNLNPKRLHLRFLVRFGHPVLPSENRPIPFLYLTLDRQSTPMLAIVTHAQSQSSHLTFLESPGQALEQPSTNIHPIPLQPARTYCIEASFFSLSRSRLHCRFWVDGKPGADVIAVGSLDHPRPAAIHLGKISRIPGDVYACFDEISLADTPLGAIPGKPVIHARNGHLASSSLGEISKAQAHRASHWQISANNSWLLPLRNTGIDSVHLTLWPHPHVIRLSDSLNRHFMFNEPVFLPTGAIAGERCLARVRHCGHNGNWSAWSSPCSFVVPESTPGPIGEPHPIVRSVRFTLPEKDVSLSQIRPAMWYDMHIRFAFSEKGDNWQAAFIDLSLMANPENALGNYASRGESFEPRTSYTFNFSIPGSQPFVRQTVGTGKFTHLVGLKGKFCDPIGDRYSIDRKNGTIRVRMRLLEHAKQGAWGISAYFKENERRVSTVYRSIFLVDQEEIVVSQPSSSPHLKVVVLGLIAFVLFGGLLTIAKSRKSRNLAQPALDMPPPTDRRIVQAHEFIANNHTNPISPKDVARHINVSPNWLSKLFKHHTGKNVIDTINELRVQKAKQLLKDTRMDVADVASNSGFNSLVHFRRIFKRSVGTSPISFRNSL